jgi:hypothetical protein
MNNQEQWDALTDKQREWVLALLGDEAMDNLEQREHVAQAIDSLADMGQEATALLVRWVCEISPIIQRLCVALLKVQADIAQIKERSDEKAYPGRGAT